MKKLILFLFIILPLFSDARVRSLPPNFHALYSKGSTDPHVARILGYIFWPVVIILAFLIIVGAIIDTKEFMAKQEKLKQEEQLASPNKSKRKKEN